MARRAISKIKVRNALKSLVRETGKQWESLKQESPEDNLKLYFRYPNDRQRVGRLKVSAEDPKRGWRLATDMEFNDEWTREEAEAFIFTHMIRMPILRPPIA